MKRERIERRSNARSNALSVQLRAVHVHDIRGEDTTVLNVECHVMLPQSLRRRRWKRRVVRLGKRIPDTTAVHIGNVSTAQISTTMSTVNQSKEWLVKTLVRI